MRRIPAAATLTASALLLATVVGGFGQALAKERDDVEKPTIVVEAAETISPLSRHLNGVNNNEWFDTAQGLWEPDRDAPDSQVLEKTARAGLNLIRYPGGTSANLFDWKKAIGPTDQRGCQLDGRNNPSGPLDSVYGPDEHMEFVTAVGADMQIMVPLANETPGDAADWVEYMNAEVGTNPRGGTAWADVRAANGHTEPYGVKFWEIGNEIDRKAERYWLSQDNHEAVRQYTFGGTQAKTAEPVGRECDHRDNASISTGDAGQRFEVRYPPVVPDSQTIYVDGTAWTEVADLSAAGRDDTVYTFDPRTGAIVFGDGTHGRIPAADAAVTADYESGPHAGYVDFYEEMKKADPNIDVCATWAPVRETSGLDAISFPALMAEQGHADDYDCVTIHPYTNFKDSRPDFNDDWETAREGHDEHFLGDLAATELLDNLRAEVAEHADSDAYVAVSEYGALWFGPGGVDLSSYRSWNTSMSHVTYMATQWTRFANRGIPWAVGNTLISSAPGGLRAVLGGEPGFAYTGEAVAREAVKPMFDAEGQVLASRVDDNQKIAAVASAPGATYDALNVTATKGTDGKLRILVVNSNPTESVSANVVPAGYVHDGHVAVTQVAGDDFTSFNSLEHPDDIQIESSTVPAVSPAFGYTFPPTSVTVLTLAADS